MQGTEAPNYSSTVYISRLRLQVMEMQKATINYIFLGLQK